MKKYLSGFIFLLFISTLITGIVVLIAKNNKDTSINTTASAAVFYGTDGLLTIPPSNGLVGTENNPFVILEIVHYEGYAEIGYLIGGCEPVTLTDLAYDVESARKVLSTDALDYARDYEYKFDLDTVDKAATGEAKWESITNQKKAQYGYYKKVADGSGTFIQNITNQEVTQATDGYGEYNKASLYTKEKFDEKSTNRVRFIPITEATPKNAIHYSTRELTQAELNICKRNNCNKYYTYDSGTKRYLFKADKFGTASGSEFICFVRDDIKGNYTAEEMPTTGETSLVDATIAYNKAETYVLARDDLGQSNGDYNINITNATYSEMGEGKGNFIWVPNEDSKNITTNHNVKAVGDKVHTSRDRTYYQRMKCTFTSKNYFLEQSLKIPADRINNYYTDSKGIARPYNIQVITITPMELNRGGNQLIIDRANLIYFSSKDHFNGDLVKIWEKYHQDKKKSTDKELADNDLTWETTVKILEKASVSDNPAPLIFDVTVYTGISASYKQTVSPFKKYSSGIEVKNDIRGDGYCSNIYKLYLIMQQMNPSKFYNEYIRTKLVVSTPTKNSHNKDVDDYGTPMTTGKYTVQKDKEAIYWSIRTFLPYKFFANYAALDIVNNCEKAWEKVGIDNYRVIVDSEEPNTSIQHNFYSYNGVKSMNKDFVMANIVENIYCTDAFNYYEGLNGVRPEKISPAQTIYYLLNKNNTVYDKTVINILEIEPCNDFIWDGTKEEWKVEGSPGSVFSYGKQFYTKFFPNFSGKVKITTMTSSEFIGKIEDLNSTYDMIFFGLQDDLLLKNATNVTIYNDSTLKGKVYLHVGDKIKALTKLEGSLEGTAEVDWYRFSGNDITKLKLEDLKTFMKAGFPIVLNQGFYKETTRANVNDYKLDKKSNIFKLAQQNLSQLFYVDGIETNKLEALLSTSKCKIQFGKIDDDTVTPESCYPLVYKDRTQPGNEGLSDDKIYINVSNKNYRTLQYKFYIEDIAAIDSTYTVKLYIDINADGKYDELTEDVSSLNIMSDDGHSISYNELKTGVNYRVTRNLEADYSGVLPWKIEIVSNNNDYIRDSFINYCALQVNAENKIHLNILQVMSNKTNTVNLSTHTDFKTYIDKLNDYTLHITTWSVDKFNTKCGNSSIYRLKDDDDNGTIVNNKEVIPYIDDDGDGLYEVDMLILGFADMYSDIENTNSLNNIEDFIEEGKSVLFTHDTTSFVNKSEAEYKDTDYWGYTINKKFRNILGMDRFGATLPKTERTNKDYHPDDYIQGYTNINLNRFSNKKLTGSTEQYASHINFSLGDASNRPGITTTYVTNVNKGQITTYPYYIDENFQVATTHGQYYQLDMESKDIVVWYCLSDTKATVQNSGTGKGTGIYSTTPNDVRNNYYIYNKGNITYSGVGHSELKDETEVKLFINTMIAAYTATAKAPQINITNDNKSSDDKGRDYIYVDYDIYNLTQAYGTEVDDTTHLQKIKFRVVENNILFNKVIKVKYYEIGTTQQPDGTIITSETELTNLKTVKVNKDVDVPYVKNEGSQLNSGEEYYIKVPLSDLDSNNKGKTICIKVLITYGKNSDKSMTSEKEFTLLRRGLFDLD